MFVVVDVGELRLIAAGGADSTLTDLQEIKTSFTE